MITNRKRGALEVIYSQQARTVLEKLPVDVQERIYVACASLAELASTVPLGPTPIRLPALAFNAVDARVFYEVRPAVGIMLVTDVHPHAMNDVG